MLCLNTYKIIFLIAPCNRPNYMTKKFLFVAIIFLYFTLLTSNLYSKTYRIGCTEDYYPYISVNEDGKPEGIIIDWWNLWSSKTGVEIEFLMMDIQSCIEKTKSGEIDAIAGLFYNKERSEYLDFSEYIMRMRTVIFLKNKIKPDSIKDIKKSIGLVENDMSQVFLHENYPEIKILPFKSNSLLINAIYQLNIDGFTYDIPNPIGNYKPPASPKGYYIFETLYVEKLRIAVKKGNSELLSLIISGSAKINDEELIEIANKWKILEKDRTTLWLGLGIGFLLILIIVFLLIKSNKNKGAKKLLAKFESKTDWQVVVNKGENDLIEFKSSLRWDYRRGKMNKMLENVIVKTLAAFLNTEGGMLFIGIDDDGNALGLDNDYSCLTKKNRDGFLLTLTNLINEKLGKNLHEYITINIISINDKDVCIVIIEKSDRPVFFGKNENEKFYIRASASSQPLAIQESYKYIRSHWDK